MLQGPERDDCGCSGDAQEQTESVGECCQPHSGGSSSRRSWMKTSAFVVVLLSAVALAGHSLLIGHANESTGDPSAGFVSVGSSCDGCSKKGSQLTEQSSKACGVICPNTTPKTNVEGPTAGKAVIFLLLAGSDVEASRRASRVLDSVTGRLAEVNRPVLSLTLREGDRGYDQMIKHFSVTSLPCVITLSQGCQSSVVKTPDIAENVLCRAFVKAIGGCGTDSTGQSSPACGATSLSSPQAPKDR